MKVSMHPIAVGPGCCVRVRGETALHAAVRTQDEALVRSLLQTDRAVEKERLNSLSPSADRSASPSASASQASLSKIEDAAPTASASSTGENVDVNAKGLNGQTPLHDAVKPGSNTPPHIAIVKLLLENGADVNAADNFGLTPLHLLVSQPPLLWEEAVSTLIDHGADLNAVGHVFGTPMHSAAFAGHEKVVRFLFSRGANVNAVKDNLGTPLHCACQAGHTHLARVLLELGADVDATCGNGTTPLMRAIGHFDVMNFLMENGANATAMDHAGDSVLHRAARFGDCPTVEFLFKCGALINGENSLGQTSLFHVCDEGATNGVMLFLIQQGADVSCRDHQGNTPLHAAAANGCPESVRTLLSLSVEILAKNAQDMIESKNNEDETPLHVAVKARQVNAARELLTANADVNAVNRIGETPLHVACGLLSVHRLTNKMVRLLREFNADVTIPNGQGATPRTIAKRRNADHKILSLLSATNEPTQLTGAHGHEQERQKERLPTHGTTQQEKAQGETKPKKETPKQAPEPQPQQKQQVPARETELGQQGLRQTVVCLRSGSNELVVKIPTPAIPPPLPSAVRQRTKRQQKRIVTERNTKLRAQQNNTAPDQEIPPQAQQPKAPPDYKAGRPSRIFCLHSGSNELVVKEPTPIPLQCGIGVPLPPTDNHQTRSEKPHQHAVDTVGAPPRGPAEHDRNPHLFSAWSSCSPFLFWWSDRRACVPPCADAFKQAVPHAAATSAILCTPSSSMPPTVAQEGQGAETQKEKQCAGRMFFEMPRGMVFVFDTSSILRISPPALKSLAMENTVVLPSTTIHELDRHAQDRGAPFFRVAPSATTAQTTAQFDGHAVPSVRVGACRERTRAKRAQLIASRTPKLSALQIRDVLLQNTELFRLQKRTEEGRGFDAANCKNNDDRILGCAVYFKDLDEMRSRNVLLVTDDGFLKIKARAEEVNAINVQELLTRQWSCATVGTQRRRTPFWRCRWQLSVKEDE